MKNIKKKHKENSLISAMDAFFVVGGEMKADNGEDSYAFSINDTHALLSVFDGCGGIGSRKYEMYGSKTGAYLSSHCCAEAIFKWFKNFCNNGDRSISKNLDVICDEIRSMFISGLSEMNKKVGSTGIRGSLTRDFPTTTSTVIITKEKSSITANFIWAGDSRGYLLTEDGITQVTRDDIYGEDDAYANLSDDGRLENMICADGKFVLNRKSISCPSQSIIITATDGCFGYFYTPMEFEYMILKTMMESHCINEWKEQLNDYMLNFTGDDYTLGIAVAGYKTFEDLKKQYIPRTKVLLDEYVRDVEKLSPDQRKFLWEKYRDFYYRSV